MDTAGRHHGHPGHQIHPATLDPDDVESLPALYGNERWIESDGDLGPIDSADVLQLECHGRRPAHVNLPRGGGQTDNRPCLGESRWNGHSGNEQGQ